ncbi:MAG: hypothetical protein PHI97_23385 [Desulfobulbus sp.]|nr:hypothetical protein [Desulfobulbus sp.]
MTQYQEKMQPWQAFHAAKKAIGAAAVARIFNRSIRAAQDWAQDPAYTQVRCKSPLELLHTLFERLDAVGFGYVARASIRYLETAIDQDVEVAPISGLKDTIDLEILEDYGAVADLQRAIEADAGIDQVMTQKQAAIDAIERTVAKYIKG